MKFNKIDNHIARVMRKSEKYKLPISGMKMTYRFNFCRNTKKLIRKYVLLNANKSNNFDEMENSFKDIKFLGSTKAHSRRNS